MTATPPPMPAAPPRGWWSRNWIWCVPVLVITAAAFIAGCFFLLVSLVLGTIKSTEPYQDSVTRAKADPKVQEVLGTPIQDGFFFTGIINTSNDSGDAQLDIPLEGPKGKGTLHVEGTRSGGIWTYPVRELIRPGTPEKIQIGP